MAKPEREDPPAPADDLRAQLAQLQQKYLTLEEQLVLAQRSENAEAMQAVEEKLADTRRTLARIIDEKRKKKKEEKPAAGHKAVQLINPMWDFMGAWRQAHDE